jgi:hypothetical protein
MTLKSLACVHMMTSRGRGRGAAAGVTGWPGPNRSPRAHSTTPSRVVEQGRAGSAGLRPAGTSEGPTGAPCYRHYGYHNYGYLKAWRVTMVSPGRGCR